jgi:hypothetical protein
MLILDFCGLSLDLNWWVFVSLFVCDLLVPWYQLVPGRQDCPYYFMLVACCLVLVLLLLFLCSLCVPVLPLLLEPWYLYGCTSYWYSLGPCSLASVCVPGCLTCSCSAGLDFFCLGSVALVTLWLVLIKCCLGWFRIIALYYWQAGCLYLISY